MHHLSSGQMLQQQSLRALVCATCDFTIKLLEVEETWKPFKVKGAERLKKEKI